MPDLLTASGAEFMLPDNSTVPLPDVDGLDISNGISQAVEGRWMRMHDHLTQRRQRNGPRCLQTCISKQACCPMILAGTSEPATGIICMLMQQAVARGHSTADT